jgi:aconitate hydratase
MSPPLVVAYALAGRVNIDLEKEPIHVSKEGKKTYLKDIWPSDKEIYSLMEQCIDPMTFKQRYSSILEDNPLWKQIAGASGHKYDWDENSTYIQKPPYFDHFSLDIPKVEPMMNMRCLAILADSVTTDHISPAGSFKSSSPAGKFLLSRGIPEEQFNSYGSRRGNHLIMMRGTFANVRIKNKLAAGKEGGYTKILPGDQITTIFEASQEYARRKTPLILFAGKDYGMGSSRDWAAKGTNLLGVRAVVAQSFERIHRSNLIGMGVLPLEFINSESVESLHITGEEQFSLIGVENNLSPAQHVDLEISHGGTVRKVKLKLRLDTPIEVDYYKSGGIMPFVLRQILACAK